MKVSFASIVTSPNLYSIHRFFDSSPFSPTSSRYLAFTEIPTIEYDLYANVSVIDLWTGDRYVLDRTAAWDSQVGAHVQWGGTDQYVYYNTIDNITQLPQAVEYDTFHHRKRYFECPIYHVSMNGKFGIAPNLQKIKYTQKGYGIHSESLNDLALKQNNYVPLDDGIFLVDIRNGTCQLYISLADIAGKVGLDKFQTPTYGFHTKWSHDRQYILFVMRTLENSPTSQLCSCSIADITTRILNGLIDYFYLIITHIVQFTNQFLSPPSEAKTIKNLLTNLLKFSQKMTSICLKRTVRVQHLFVIHVESKNISHIISWASKSFHPIISNNFIYSRYNQQHNLNDRTVKLCDGNHPTWIPNSHKISMNLESNCQLPYEVNTVNLHKTEYDHSGKWDVVVFDIDSINNQENETFNRIGSSAFEQSNSSEQCQDISKKIDHSSVIIYSKIGTGHPNFHPDGRHLVMDAYMKEVNHLNKTGRSIEFGAVPLRLIDVKTFQESWLLEMKICVNCKKGFAVGDVQSFKEFSKYGIRNENTKSKLSDSSEIVEDIIISNYSWSRLQSQSWRCDLHPAWSRDFKWIAINGRPQGLRSQITVIHVD